MRGDVGGERLSVGAYDKGFEVRASICLPDWDQEPNRREFEVALESSRNQKVGSMTTDPAARDVHHLQAPAADVLAHGETPC